MKKRAFSILVITISLCFYLFFAFYDGVVISFDSPGYISMQMYREPFYPIFLALFRALCMNLASDTYLMAVILVQSILAAISVWSMTMYLTKEFQLDRFWAMIIFLLLLVPSFFWRIIIWHHSVYSNSILTEGIAISCYILFFRFLLEYIIRQTRKSFFSCCIFVFILISTRKQMFISLMILLICILAVSFNKKEYRKGLVTAFLCFICIFSGKVFFDLGYNYVVRGEAVEHSGDTRFITTMAFYTADRTDSQYIKDKNIEEVFLEIYDICDEQGLLKTSASGGWTNRISHLIDSYDAIQLKTMWPAIKESADQYYHSEEVQLNKRADDIMDIINYSVIPHNLPAIFRVFADNFVLGLIMTVSHRLYSVLRWYSLFIYLCYLLLLFYHVWRNENRKIYLFAAITLISIIVNVGLVAPVIFCQTRYMIYNTALFYISLVLMIKPFLDKMLTCKKEKGL